MPELSLLLAVSGGAAACGVLIVVLLRRLGQKPGPPTLQPRPRVHWTTSIWHRPRPSERRSARRRTGGSVDVLIADAGQKLHPIEGNVLDRSVGGIGVEVSDPLPGLSPEQSFAAGTLLVVRPVGAPEEIGWVRVEVRYCVPRQRGWRVGLRYLHTPPYNILSLFG